ncbi:hypothetical protein L7F22_012608 [Adiantum nelumboides]|nr:hypothetical protein [Adiantum nelumboides]
MAHATGAAAVDQVAQPAGAVQRRLQLPPTITLPVIPCSHPLRTHAGYKAIQEQADAWMLSVLKPSSPEEADRLVQALYPFVTCSTHVEVEESLCLVASKYTAWLFFVDDLLDDLGGGLGRRVAAAKALFQAIDQTLLTAEATSQPGSLAAEIEDWPEKYNVSAAATTVVLEGWWNEMRANMSAAYQARFRHFLHRFLSAASAQVERRQAGLLPDLHTYTASRRDTICVMPCVVLLECWHGVPYDETVLDCDLLVELRAAAFDHIGWTNDIHSFKVEYCKGDFHNIVALVWLQQPDAGASDLQTCVDMVAKMIEQKDREFSRLLHKARACQSLMATPGMEKYLQGLADWVSGNFHWNYYTNRYYSGRELKTTRSVDAPLTFYF